ncbi:MAG: MaoC family dehydratase [Gammaproteobacteria bacterium]|nr:MaoC family dehydratase [Gammaproteobacteria bacterium]MYF38695.1 MaoC family dehydratase [Gammaproteobacteria bacterium]
MNDQIQTAYESLTQKIGQSETPTDWFEITQERVNTFADATLDHQWIHVDPERAKTGPFGTTIAHGDLTLSIMNQLPRQLPISIYNVDGLKHMLNYGFDRVRFPAPVLVGSRIRAHSTLKRVEFKKGMIEIMVEVSVEAEGNPKPCCVAENLFLLVF